jgi:hypothetical protein
MPVLMIAAQFAPDPFSCHGGRAFASRTQLACLRERRGFAWGERADPRCLSQWERFVSEYLGWNLAGTRSSSIASTATRGHEAASSRTVASSRFSGSGTRLIDRPALSPSGSASSANAARLKDVADRPPGGQGVTPRSAPASLRIESGGCWLFQRPHLQKRECGLMKPRRPPKGECCN